MEVLQGRQISFRINSVQSCRTSQRRFLSRFLHPRAVTGVEIEFPGGGDNAQALDNEFVHLRAVHVAWIRRCPDQRARKFSESSAAWIADGPRGGGTGNIRRADRRVHRGGESVAIS